MTLILIYLGGMVGIAIIASWLIVTTFRSHAERIIEDDHVAMWQRIVES